MSSRVSSSVTEQPEPEPEHGDLFYCVDDGPKYYQLVRLTDTSPMWCAARLGGLGTFNSGTWSGTHLTIAAAITGLHPLPVGQQITITQEAAQ